MRAGIYLGPPIGRARRLAGILFWLGGLATLVHVSSYLRERGELSVLRGTIEGGESPGSQVLSEPLGADAATVLRRLRAVSVSGTTVTVSPTEMLHLIGSAVPDQVALVHVSFEPASSPPSLLIEAIARREADVTTLQKRVTDSRRVQSTQLLGERASLDGTVSVRLQVDLAPEP